MEGRCFLVLFLAATLAHGAAPELGVQRLRSLAVLPTLTASLAIDLDDVENPECRLSKAELARRIAILERELKQNPTDGAGWLRLAGYLSNVERKEELQRALGEATGHLRGRAEAQPRDGLVQAQSAQALLQDRKVPEAERVLRSAIKSMPEDWVCWAGLGDLLDAKFFVALGWGTGANKPGGSFEQELRAFRLHRATPNQVQEADQCQTEADLCFERAVKLAPQEPRVMLARAVHRSRLACELIFKSSSLGLELEKEEIVRAMSSSEVTAVWAEAVKLNPTNYGAVAYLGWCEFAPYLLQASDQTKPIDALSNSRRKNLLEAMRLLETASENRNSHLAAEALEDLGVLRFMATLETPAAKSAFRRAVTLDPSRPRSWEGLVGVAVRDENFQELISVCEERLKYEDTVGNRVFLAKACDRAGLADKALAHARAAVALEATNAVGQLSLGALLLRRAEDPKANSEFKEHLVRALALILQIENEEVSGPLAVACGLDMAIMSALEGDTDKARKTLHMVCNMNAAEEKDKERAKEIETAIGK